MIKFTAQELEFAYRYFKRKCRSHYESVVFKAAVFEAVLNELLLDQRYGLKLQEANIRGNSGRTTEIYGIKLEVDNEEEKYRFVATSSNKLYGQWPFIQGREPIEILPLPEQTQEQAEPGVHHHVDRDRGYELTFASKTDQMIFTSEIIRLQRMFIEADYGLQSNALMKSTPPIGEIYYRMDRYDGIERIDPFYIGSPVRLIAYTDISVGKSGRLVNCLIEIIEEGRRYYEAANSDDLLSLSEALDTDFRKNQACGQAAENPWFERIFERAHKLLHPKEKEQSKEQ